MSIDQHHTAARDPRVTHEPSVAQLIRETSSQLRDSIDTSRLEVAQLVVRVTRVEDRISRGRDSTRSLWWLAGVAALLGFLTTSLTWQVSHRAAALQSALRSTTALVERSAQASTTAFARIDSTLAAQEAAAGKLAAAIASVETTGRQMQAALADLDRDADRTADTTGLIGRQLTDTALELSTLRRELDAQLREHHQAVVAGRGEMLAAVTESIGRVEADLRRQAEELKAQREQVDASAIRMRQTQQRMLGEATQAVAAQLEGLRQILDGLEGDIADGETTVINGAAAPAAATDTPAVVESSEEPPQAELAGEAAAAGEVIETTPPAAVDADAAAVDAAVEQPAAEPVTEVAAGTPDTVTE